MGWWIFLGLVVAAIIYGCIWGAHVRKETKRTNREYENALEREVFTIDKKIEHVQSILFVDNSNKMWSLKENNKSVVKIHKFSDLVRFDMGEDGQTVAYATAGGVLEGWVNFSKISAEIRDKKGNIRAYCNSLQLVVKVDDTQTPVKKVVFIDSLTKLTDDSYINGVAAAEDMVAALVDMMDVKVQERAADERYVEPEPVPEQEATPQQKGMATGQSIADAMRQLTRMKESGMISEDEYNWKRAELLKRM